MTRWLEEWLDYLKNDHIRSYTTTPGLKEAREKLVYYDMDPSERAAYDRHVDAIMIQNDVLGTAKFEGLVEGRAEGRTEGILEVARNMKKMGISVETIIRSTGLRPEEVEPL